ncbi:1,4-alpha-glucan branching protein [Streptomyces sp. ID05-04B]|uniref:maltokinase N-terminal cap-like domain-containing protein n=1 Tax=unclassified Streptomyces TaxID=2593676 RepID=UPI000D1BA777|nr:MULTISPECIES: 1,4-alpha-glucan branching protein [unclassified Streptomyces]AVV44479.1 1,4-alpha-glucan branching protein [Streptomyces sp. P3]MDX5566013.1 1,4-alpha-glucan branching protein [Streptomyces sp. ID05-04B]
MAVIHHTVLKPTKLELLTSWLPTRPWYVGGGGRPEPAKAGGFRLDDPQGEVGIEFMVVTDTAGPHPAAYLVPLTYRGAPLVEAEHALVGTMEHGVLGRRWVYDGCQDPVLVAQLLALIEGRVQAQAQSTSDAPDREVTRSYTGVAPLVAPPTASAADDRDGTELPAPNGTTLRLQRLLAPVPDDAHLLPPGATGHVAGPWLTPAGTRERSLFAVLLAAPRA